MIDNNYKPATLKNILHSLFILIHSFSRHDRPTKCVDGGGAIHIWRIWCGGNRDRDTLHRYQKASYCKHFKLHSRGQEYSWMGSSPNHWQLEKTLLWSSLILWSIYPQNFIATTHSQSHCRYCLLFSCSSFNAKMHIIFLHGPVVPSKKPIEVFCYP